MLKECPECSLPVSDKASTCPHCGYPLKKPTKQVKRTTKHKRLPNGFGRITELHQNLRNPYRAMVTTGFNSTGRPIGTILGYYKTYNDAYSALTEYHKHPCDLDSRITVQELYEKWTDEYFQNIKPSATRTVTSAWLYCNSVYDLKASELRARHIKYCMESGEANIKGEIRHPTASTKTRIKSLFNLMLDYAVEYEIVDKNYARTFEISKDVIKEREEAKRQHLSFTDEEMAILWQNISDYWTSVVVFQCYTGFRPQELGLIERDKVDLENMTIIGGMKTEAGTDRLVPIHPKIQEIAKKIYHSSDSRFFITDEKGEKLTYDKYKSRFKHVIEDLHLNPEHRPHDPRKQFVTMAKKAEVDDFAIKRIVGHTISDLTEKTYTDRDTSWLMEQLIKIPYEIYDCH